MRRREQACGSRVRSGKMYTIDARVGIEPGPMAYPDGMALHDMLAARRDDVMLRWNAQVRGTLAPEAMPSLELADHIPEFVDEIASALRTDAGIASGGRHPREAQSRC